MDPFYIQPTVSLAQELGITAGLPSNDELTFSGQLSGAGMIAASNTPLITANSPTPAAPLFPWWLVVLGFGLVLFSGDNHR